MADRDVLKELDSAEAYLNQLIGEEPLDGQASNKKDLALRMAPLRALAQNIVELAAEYSSGVTPRQRMSKAIGQELTHDQTKHMWPAGDSDYSANADQARIAQLEAENAALRASKGSDK